MATALATGTPGVGLAGCAAPAPVRDERSAAQAAPRDARAAAQSDPAGPRDERSAAAPSAGPRDERPAAAPSVGPPWTARGRCDDPRALTWRVEPAPPDGVVVPDVDLRAALRRAAAAWTSTGAVAWREARADEAPGVVVGWRRGAHDGCPPFGRSPTAAHAGPVAPASFVHLDASRAWGGDDGLDLERALVHELGHVAGLDHVADPAAVMRPDPVTSAPGAGDVAGLRSLYGGGVDGPGDLHLLPAEDEGATRRSAGGELPSRDTPSASRCVLRRLAPPATTEVGLLDVDGDGAAELLLLRADGRGQRALEIVRFATGPVVVRTEGPFPGFEPAGASTVFTRDARGVVRVFTSDAAGALLRVRRFDERGRLVEGGPEDLASAVDGASPVDARSTVADVDGDGRAERLARRE